MPELKQSRINQDETEAVHAARGQAAPVSPPESSVVIEMLENMPSSVARGVVYLLVVMIVAGVAFSYFGKIDVTVKARGKLIPKGDAQVVQPATSGIVKTIDVKEGDMVDKGALLATLDVTRSSLQQKTRQSNLQKKLKQIQCLNKTIDVMTSVVVGKQVQIDAADIQEICSPEDAAAVLGLKSAQMEYDKAMMRAREMYPASLQTLESGVRNRELNLEQKKQLLEASQRDLERTRSQRQLYQTMYDQGLTSKIKLFEEQKKYDEALTKVKEEELNLDSARGELEDARVKLDAAEKNYATETRQARETFELALLKHNNQIKAMQDKLESLQTDLANFNLESNLIQQQIAYHQLTSPVKGRVAFVKIRTPGEIVKAGETAFLINPVDQPLVARIDITNKSVGRVFTGMPVKIKMDAYPYQNYGIVSGKIFRIAPDSKQQGALYSYEALVSLDQTFVEKNNKKYPLFTGLTLQAEIVVEKQRIIQNLIDPLKKFKE